MSTLQFYLFIMPVVLSVGILVIRGGLESMRLRRRNIEELKETAEELARRERINNARLPKGDVAVRTWNAQQESEELIGTLMLVGVGSYGLNMLVRLLTLLYVCGLQRLVGTIILVEHNTNNRRRFFERVDEIFHGRVVLGFAEGWSTGLANSPTSIILDNIHYWGRTLKQAASEAVDLHERLTQYPPGQILFFWSLGGQAPMGLPILEVLRAKFSKAQIFGMTSLPHHTRNRAKFAELRGEYEDDVHGVAGWVVSEELSPDRESADTAMAALIVAPSSAQLFDDQTTQLNNVLALAFTQQPGGILTLQYVHEKLPAWAWVVEGEQLGYYAKFQRVAETVQGALGMIEAGRGNYTKRAVLGESGTSVYDIVMTNLGYDERHERDDMLELAETITDGYQQRLARLRATNQLDRFPGMLFGKYNYDLKFGSMAAVITDNKKPQIEVVVMRLAAVKDGATCTSELIKVPEELKLPHDRTPQLPAPQGTPSANGKGVIA